MSDAADAIAQTGADVVAVTMMSRYWPAVDERIGHGGVLRRDCSPDRDDAGAARRLRPDHIFWSKYQPLPGTVLGDPAVLAAPVELERFNDYRRLLLLIDSRCVDDEAHPELFARFDVLKEELAAGRTRGAAGRAVDTLPYGQ